MDHIRDFFYYPDEFKGPDARHLTESEYNLIMLYRRMELSGGTDIVYKNAKGQVLPALLREMLSIRSYEHPSGNDSRAGKQWFDL